MLFWKSCPFTHSDFYTQRETNKWPEPIHPFHHWHFQSSLLPYVNPAWWYQLSNCSPVILQMFCHKNMTGSQSHTVALDEFLLTFLIWNTRETLQCILKWIHILWVGKEESRTTKWRNNLFFCFSQMSLVMLMSPDSTDCTRTAYVWWCFGDECWLLYMLKLILWL